MTQDETASPLSGYSFTEDDTKRAVAARIASNRARKQDSEESIVLELLKDARVMAREGSTELIRAQGHKLVDMHLERLRILRNKPLPGSYKPEADAKASKRTASSGASARTRTAELVAAAKASAAPAAPVPDVPA